MKATHHKPSKRLMGETLQRSNMSGTFSAAYPDQATSETRVAASDTQLWTHTMATAVQQLSTVDLCPVHAESEEARTVALSLKEPFFYALGGL